MIRIIIVDDHVMVRQGLKKILQSHPDMNIVAEAGSCQELLDLIPNTTCDVIILDVTLPGRSGLDILNDLKQTAPEIPVLVLSMHPEDQLAARVLKAGGAGYVNKESASDVLIDAIQKVVAGGKYITPKAAESLAEFINGVSKEKAHIRLSAREFEILRGIASGKNVTQMAAELSLSIKTVSTYRCRILEKLGLETNAQLIRYALDHSLIS